MNGNILALVVTLLVPVMLIAWNRIRVKGKLLCVIVRKDKSVIFSLCELKNDFVIFKGRAYDVYPDFVRVAKFPAGGPPILQEIVPCSIYDEEDAVPLDWIDLDNRLERSMSLNTALEENWLRKLVQEAATVGGGFQINWRKVLPILLIAIGVLGLVVLLAMKGCALPKIPGGG